MFALGSKNLVPQEKYAPFFARPFFLMEFLLTEFLLWDFFGRFFGQQKIHRRLLKLKNNIHSQGFQGLPKMVSFLYYSHTIPISLGILMGLAMKKKLVSCLINRILSRVPGSESSLRWTPIFPNGILRVPQEHPLPLDTPGPLRTLKQWVSHPSIIHGWSTYPPRES